MDAAMLKGLQNKLAWLLAVAILAPPLTNVFPCICTGRQNRPECCRNGGDSRLLLLEECRDVRFGCDAAGFSTVCGAWQVLLRRGLRMYLL